MDELKSSNLVEKTIIAAHLVRRRQGKEPYKRNNHSGISAFIEWSTIKYKQHINAK